jgi:hypothetical protein
MPLRFCHSGDFHLDEDRYFADTGQCLEWFVADSIRAGVDFFVINGDLTTYKATIKERNFWVDRLVEMANHAPVILVAGNHGAELEGDLYVFGRARGTHPIYVCTEFADLDARVKASRREIENADRRIVSSRRERDSLIARQAQIKQRQEQLEAARTRLARVEAELGTKRTEQEDYTYLAQVFGPDEIQLCEIQAAGPQVSILVNALLEGCFDNKFEIRFRTQRPKADGKGMVDDFDVEVRNKNLDRTCLVYELSGGQFVLVNEAVNLGIAIYNMRQGEGIRHETLFRDETVGALDAVNGKEYVCVLRRAMELGGFHQVIFICHTPLVLELADTVLSVGGGCVVMGDQQASPTG